MIEKQPENWNNSYHCCPWNTSGTFHSVRNLPKHKRTFWHTLCFSLSVLSKEVCQSNIVMCPRCDKRCTAWQLSDTCTYAKVGSFNLCHCTLSCFPSSSSCSWTDRIDSRCVSWHPTLIISNTVNIGEMFTLCPIYVWSCFLVLEKWN